MGDGTEGCRTAGCRSRVPGAGGTGGNVSAGEEEGRGRSCQGLRLWSLTVSSGCTGPAPLRSAPPRPAAMETLGRGSASQDPAGLCHFVSLRSLYRWMLTALLLAHWRLLLTVLSVPGSWCLCSSDSPGCLPGLRSASCRKLTTAGTPGSWAEQGRGGRAMSSHLCFFPAFPPTRLLDCLPGS